MFLKQARAGQILATKAYPKVYRDLDLFITDVHFRNLEDILKAASVSLQPSALRNKQGCQQENDDQDVPHLDPSLDLNRKRRIFMALTALNKFSDVQQFIAKVLTDNNESGDVANSPHGAFWSALTYDQFVNGNVPGVHDPSTGQPISILAKEQFRQLKHHSLRYRVRDHLFDPNTGLHS